MTKDPAQITNYKDINLLIYLILIKIKKYK